MVTTPTQSPATGLLNVQAVAAELQTTPQAVQRLIAKRVLPASRLGPDGDFRIDVDAVAAYIKANCPDLEFPKLDQVSWFADEPSGGEAGKLVHSMIEAELDGGQLLTDDKIEKWKSDNRRENVLAVDLRVTVSRSLWTQRPSTPLVKARGAEPSKPMFRTVGEMALAYLFLRRLRTVLDQGPKIARAGGRLAKLYATPEQFSGCVTKTVAELLAGRVPFEERQTLTVGPSKHQVVVKYGFTFATLTTLGQLQQLATKIL